MSTFDREIARLAVGGYDDSQDVRTSMMNRVRDIVRKKNEGIPFDQVEEEKEEQSFDSKYEDDNLSEIISQMREDEKLTEREYGYLNDMLEAAELAAEMEDRYGSVMGITESEPIYTEWLDNVYGVSTTLTARLIHQFGYCENFEKVSNLWSYAGLAPGQKRERGEQLNYSPDAKKLGWLVADNMIKQGSNSQYRVAFYDPYKEKQTARMHRHEQGMCINCGQREAVAPSGDDDPTLCEPCFLNDEPNPTPPTSKGHADNRARRYLAKKFLKHYWYISRDLKGLSTPDEWVITHGGHDKETETFENPAYAKRELQKLRV